MIIYGLKSCDSCRKAKKALPGAEVVDIRADGLPDDVRAAALNRFGAALINRRSTTWRGLDEAARELAPEVLLDRHPALMKRPLIVDGDRMVLGWDRTAQAALGLV